MFSFLCMVFAVCANASNPVHMSVGKPVRISDTCIHIPLQLTVQDGKRIYGPEAKGTVPTDIKVSGKNIVDFRVKWPVHRGSDPVFKKTGSILLEVDLSGRGDADACIDVSGLACSNMCETFSLRHVHAIKAQTSHGTWIKMLFFAFLGGLILNIMPCVLPVLGLKIKGFVNADPRSFRRMCQLTIVGIVSGFWVLAAMMVVIRVVFGLHVGWGSHLLQSPLFASVMSLVMMGGAYGLWGVFHVNPPQWAGRMLSAQHTGTVGYLLSGFLAVLLATPCSAPFLGASVGFALAGNALEIFLFYTAIGLGFALPYFLCLFFSFEKILPKPGPWMNGVSRLMGFLFVASSAWLLWMVSGFLDPFWTGCVWGIWGVLAVWPLGQKSGFVIKRPLVFYGAPCVLGLFFIFSVIDHTHVHHAEISLRDGRIQWDVLNRDTLEKALQDGKIVYIDITGRGCALCMVNKRLYQKSVIQDLLTHRDVVCLRGDFGVQSAYISAFLRRYGRSAIPFNMVISQKHPTGMVLSEYLTVDTLKNGLAFFHSLKSP